MAYYPTADHETHCAHCGTALTGRQERFCSTACRVAARRPKPARTCRLCGAPFTLYTRRQSVCDYDREADERCQGLQDEAEDVAAMAAFTRMSARCEHCRGEVSRRGRGRPRKYCSPRCRSAAHRARKVTGVTSC